MATLSPVVRRPAAVAPPKAPTPTYSPAPAPAPAAAPVVLRVTGLHKSYGSVHALNGVDLEVRRGEVMGFLGPNGAGKTTFTRCVLGFLRPTSGRVELFGLDTRAHSRDVLNRVGVVPDQYDFYGNLTGRMHLDFYGRLFGIPRNELRARIDEVVTLTGMQEFVGRKVRGYSHGMKQRLCIAQAVINRPEFIVFDEPTNGLDPRGAFETRQLIKSLASRGTTVFLSSHILPEVEDVCSRVAILNKGRVVVQSNVADLRKRLKGDRTRVTIQLEAPNAGLPRLVLDRAAAQTATLSGTDLVCDLGPGQSITDLVALLVKSGARVRGVQEEQAGLEEIFLQLTQGQGGV